MVDITNKINEMLCNMRYEQYICFMSFEGIVSNNVNNIILEYEIDTQFIMGQLINIELY